MAGPENRSGQQTTAVTAERTEIHIMNATKEIVSANKVKLTITLDKAEFEEGLQVAYRKLVKQINIPGFRKGKAPRKIIENYYGEGVFYEEAFNHCFPAAYDKAVAENDLFPVEQPTIDIVSIGSQEDTVFTAEFFVKPEVTLGDYKGIKIEKPSYPVTDKDVDDAIQADANRMARWIDVERAAQLGDRATIDYAGTVDGVAFAGGTSENYALDLGSGAFIPGFEDQVVGMEVGTERDINVTFPTEYHATELAGKDAVFHVKLNALQEKESPELDDEFAKDVSSFDTFEEYKNDIKTRLTQQAAEREDNEFTNTVVDAVAANATVEIPQPMIETEIDAMVRDMSMRFAYQGLQFEDYLKYTGQTLEAVRDQYRETAEKRVRGELVLEAVRKAENLEATQEDIDALVEKYAAQTGTDKEGFTARFTDTDWEYIKTDAAVQKTIDFLKANAAE